MGETQVEDKGEPVPIACEFMTSAGVLCRRRAVCFAPAPGFPNDRKAWCGHSHVNPNKPENKYRKNNEGTLIARKFGRNDLCPCGSGIKAKKCRHLV